MNLPLESANLLIQVIKPIILISSLIIIKHLYSSWMFSSILNRLLKWTSSSSTSILFLFEKRSLIMLHFLIIVPLIFSLFSFNNVALYAVPLSVSFLLLVETPFTLHSHQLDLSLTKSLSLLVNISSSIHFMNWHILYQVHQID